MRDVAPSAAGDEDLGANLFRAVEQQYGLVRRQAAREDRCRQAGGAGADDDEVATRADRWRRFAGSR